MPIRIYDEARLAINAFEMYKSGNYIVTTFDGMPDLWNTKPPFFIWFQVAFIKLIGYNELALRLPSAISGLLVIVALIQFSKNYLNSFFLGFLSFIVLISSAGFVSIHGTRTGDYDVMVTLFMFLYSICYFLYLEKGSIKYIVSFGILVGLAVLTKSIVGLMFLPALLLYTITSKNFFRILGDKYVYLGLFLAITLIGGFYTIREISEPGFIAAVQENELGGRYLKPLENHTQAFLFYWENSTQHKFAHWIPLFILGIFIGMRSSTARIRRITLFSSFIIVSYFLAISFSQTKLHWYDIPLYPFLALITGIALKEIYQLINLVRLGKHRIIASIAAFLFLLLVSYEPYRKVFKSVYVHAEATYEADFYEISYFLKAALEDNHEVKNKVFVYNGYHPQTKVYIHMLHEKGIPIREKNYKNLEINDQVIMYQEIPEVYFHSKYQSTKTNEFGNVQFYTIKGINYVD